MNGKFFRYVIADKGSTGDDNKKNRLAEGVGKQMDVVKHDLLAQSPPAKEPSPLAVAAAAARSVAAAAAPPAQRPPPVAAAAARSANAAPPVQRPPPVVLEHHWDLSLLQPVRKKTNAGTRPKKIIELVNSITDDVIVCFRGTTDACRALGLGRAEVLAACASGDTLFKGYSLRHGNPFVPTKAYEYGAHNADYKKSEETHEARLARFIKVHAEDSKLSLPVPEPDIAADATLPPPKVIHELEQTARIAEPMTLALPGLSNMHHDMTCMLCQAAQVQVVFEPCYHCVLCEPCSMIGCKVFCPLCRTPITGKCKPKAARLVRPRVYSAYSFM